MINKANRQCCDVDMRVLSTMKPFLNFETANVTTVDLSADSVYARKKGAKAIAFANPIEGTMSIEAQVKPFKLYAMLTDGTISTTGIIAERQIIKCAAEGTLTIPAGAVAGTVFVFELGEYGETDIQGTFTGTTFTATTVTDLAVDTMYEVGYLVTKSTGVNIVSFNNKVQPLDYYITMSTVEKDESGLVTPYLITAYKATPKRSLSLSFSSEGDPASVKIDFDLMEDANGKVLDMIEETA